MLLGCFENVLSGCSLKNYILVLIVNVNATSLQVNVISSVQECRKVITRDLYHKLWTLKDVLNLNA